MDKEFRHIYEYIKLLPDDRKATDEVYKNRLSVCKNCDELVSGICKKCGCYVEMRAAIINGYCPHEKHLW